LLAVLGSTVIGMACITSSAAPAQAGLRLAYGFDGASVDGVYVVRASGLNRHRVTHGLRPPTFGRIVPTWSPDGTRIAFNAAPRLNSLSMIYTVRPNGTGQVRLTNGGRHCFGDYALDWSAHSQHLVFQRDGCDEVTIWRVRRDGTQLKRLTTGPVDPEDTVELSPNWSPDSRWIAYVSQEVARNYRNHIWLMRRDGSGKRQLTESPAYDPGESPAPTEGEPDWSPDSTTLVYTEWQGGGNSDICTVPITGGPRHCLTDAPGLDSDAHYSPDGQQIVFTSDRNGSTDLWVMDADGSNEHALTNEPGLDYQQAWSPNGNWIAFISDRGGQVDLYAIRPDGSELRRLTRNAGIESGPTWAPLAR
jgi:Tol biopolymer transport system component